MGWSAASDCRQTRPFGSSANREIMSQHSEERDEDRSVHPVCASRGSLYLDNANNLAASQGDEQSRSGRSIQLLVVDASMEGPPGSKSVKSAATADHCAIPADVGHWNLSHALHSLRDCPFAGMAGTVSEWSVPPCPRITSGLATIREFMLI